jgi:hypothetical protein
VIADDDRTQLRETVDRLRAVADMVETTEDDAELLDLAADSLHMYGWILETIADHVRFASLARSKPEAFAKGLVALDPDELDRLGDLLHEEAADRRRP